MTARVADEVQLKPERPTRNRGDLLDRVGGHRAEGEDGVAPPRSDGSREVATTTGDSSHPGGRENHRHVERLAGHRDTLRSLIDPDELARTKLHTFEGTAVLAQRDLVVGAAVDEVERDAWKPALGPCPRLVDVQQLSHRGTG